MNITTAFPSKYLKASDLQGRSVEVTIATIVMEEIGQGDDKQEKPVIYFVGKEKGIICNVINGKMIAESYGDETDDWVGQLVEIYPDKTSFKGDIVDCIRVRIPGTSPPAGDEGDVPF